MSERPIGNVNKTWRLYWSPEGRCIATVEARTSLSAIRKAPKPYRKYPGEIYAVRETRDCDCPVCVQLRAQGKDALHAIPV